MRQNVKINIPAVISGLTIGHGTLNATISDFSNELLIKRSDKTAVLLRGKNKINSRVDKIMKLINSFYSSQDLDQPSLEVIYTENIARAHQLGNDEGLIAAVYLGLSELHKHGMTADEIFKQLITDNLITTSHSRAQAKSLLKGGFLASMPMQDLYQKIYIPRGIKLIVFLPLETKKQDDIVDHIPLQAELANFILSMQVSNFAALRKSIRHINNNFEAYSLCMKHHALGVVRSEHVYIALCQNSLDADNIISEFKSKKYSAGLSSFNNEGISMY